MTNAQVLFTITMLGSENVSNCYNVYKYVVKSHNRLSMETIHALHQNGLLGAGQSYTLMSQCDGKEHIGEKLPTMYVYNILVQCDTGDLIISPATVNIF